LGGKGVLTSGTRVDLALLGKEDRATKFIIEVKRASAGPTKIDADLKRLAEAKMRLPKVRTFLFVISEAKRPKRFVTENGFSKKRKFTIPRSAGHFFVRYTLKATHAFKEPNRVEFAQYACVIEVLT
jgi:hypothetical protein